MSDLLASVFSRSDAFKRRLIDALRNPGAALEQMGGNAMDKLNTASDMLSQSAAEGPSLQGPATKRLMNAMADAYNPAGMIVYHGSPHAFTRFDASKIGTGEGAQAYGHGLYFAESPKVAESYAAMDSPFAAAGLKGQAATVAALAKIDGGKNPAKFLKDNYQAQASKWGKADVDAAIQSLENGNLYKVDLPDEKIARMLDWDKPLSQQAPEVQSLIGEELKRIGGSAHTGERAYKELMFESRMQGNRSASGAMRNNVEALQASKRLQELGIPGIRYLDQGSRNISQRVQTAMDGLEYWKKVGDPAKIAQAERVLANAEKMAGRGTSNFVVFPGEEAALTILERNNQPLIEALRKRKGP